MVTNCLDSSLVAWYLLATTAVVPDDGGSLLYQRLMECVSVRSGDCSLGLSLKGCDQSGLNNSRSESAVQRWR